MDDNGIHITSEGNPLPMADSPESYCSILGSLQYVALHFAPWLLYFTSTATRGVQNVRPDDIKTINRMIMKYNGGLAAGTFPPWNIPAMDLNQCRLVLFVDASKGNMRVAARWGYTVWLAPLGVAYSPGDPSMGVMKSPGMLLAAGSRQFGRSLRNASLTPELLGLAKGMEVADRIRATLCSTLSADPVPTPVQLLQPHSLTPPSNHEHVHDAHHTMTSAYNDAVHSLPPFAYAPVICCNDHLGVVQLVNGRKLVGDWSLIQDLAFVRQQCLSGSMVVTWLSSEYMIANDLTASPTKVVVVCFHYD